MQGLVSVACPVYAGFLSAPGSHVRVTHPKHKYRVALLLSGVASRSTRLEDMIPVLDLIICLPLSESPEP